MRAKRGEAKLRGRVVRRVLGLGEAQCAVPGSRVGFVPGLSRVVPGCPVVVPLVSKLEKWASLVLRENKESSFFEFWHKPLLCPVSDPCPLVVPRCPVVVPVNPM